MRKAIKKAKLQKLAIDITKTVFYTTIGIIISYWAWTVFFPPNAEYLAWWRSHKDRNIAKAARSTVDQQAAPPPAESRTRLKQEKKWWQGGTLHDATVKEWQQATTENKLATCADWIAKAHHDKRLTNEIARRIDKGGMPALKLLAESLMSDLNEAVKENDNGSMDNNKIGDLVIMDMMLAGWHKAHGR